MKLKSTFTVSILAVATALPAWSDTLILRNGRTISGILAGANPNTIVFQDRSGRKFRYSVNEVDSIQIGDGPYNSGNYGPPPQPQPAPPPPPPPPPNYNGNYDQSRMERVVLPPGTVIAVRTNERIDSHEVVEGQTFSGQIDQDILDTDGSIAIPRGSEAWLVTRRLEGNGDITLDVDSVAVQGRRYRVSTADQELENHRDGVGANTRTGQFVGGGAVLGAVIGAIAGGGKGAAIGAAAGAGAGAATQIVTRGKEVHVPAESVIRFQLDRPLRLHLWS